MEHEIKVTSEMEEAGYQVLRDSGLLSNHLGAPETPQGVDVLLVVDIYRAMFAVQNQESPVPTF